MNKKLIEEIKLHIIDGIRSLRLRKPDIAQAEHNFFEIANHLELEDEQVCDNYGGSTELFRCRICGVTFDKFYKDKDYDDVCKYCVEFELNNETLKKEK